MRRDRDEVDWEGFQWERTRKMVKATKREALRDLLWRRLWVAHLGMRAVGGTRFGARLAELRAGGMKIEKRFHNGGWQYRRA